MKIGEKVNLGNFGQVWTSLDEFGQVWTSLGEFGQVRTRQQIRIMKKRTNATGKKRKNLLVSEEKKEEEEKVGSRISRRLSAN